MQKWQYAYLYEVEAGRIGEPGGPYFTVTEASGIRPINEVYRVGALNALGAEGWIISPNEVTRVTTLHKGWLFDHIKERVPVVVHVNFQGQFFMRRPIDDDA